MSRSISLRFVCVLALAWTLIPNLVAAQPEAPVAETPAAADDPEPEEAPVPAPTEPTPPLEATDDAPTPTPTPTEAEDEDEEEAEDEDDAPPARTEVDLEAWLEASPPFHAPEVELEERGPPSYEPFFTLGGEYRFRLNAMSDIPLRPLPRTDPASSGELGQNYWAEQWLRLRMQTGFRPELRLIAEGDVLYGVAFGDLAQGTSTAMWPRDEYGYPGIRLRHLYLEWLTPVGLLRLGQMGFSWGLGMVANGGDQQPVFGDYRYGDLVRRALFAIKPDGLESPYAIGVGFDWVAWDQTADFERRGDVALQGLLAFQYDDTAKRNTVGAYVAYRHQENRLGDVLDVVVGDVFARWHVEDGTGGRLFAALEAAYIRGETTFARTNERERQDVEQLLGVLQLGRLHPDIDLVLETGYASGDSDTYDAIQSRGTFDPDHRVGLIMFSEVLAAQTARAAHLAQSDALVARPSRGAELIPTNGGVAGAFYLFPYAIWRPWEWIEGRLGGVFGYATSDVVDPYAQQALSESQNFRGGDPRQRELGFEIDASILLHGDLTDDLVLSGGVEGGLYLPGAALNDAAGDGLGPIGLVRARLGLSL